MLDAIQQKLYNIITRLTVQHIEREGEKMKRYHIYFTTPGGEKQRLTDDAIEAESSAEALEIWADCVRDNSNGEFEASGEEYAEEE